MSTTLQVSALNFTLNAREFFTLIAHQPWSMLLDSGNTPHIDANVDIIVFNPSISLTTLGANTTIVNHRDNSELISQENPFDLIQAQLKLLDLSDCPSELPFSGGALGYFSYDLARRCERLKQQSLADIALPEMAIGIYQHAIVFDHNKEQISFVSRSTPQAHQKQLNTITKIAQKTNKLVPFHLNGDWQNQLSYAQYQDKFNRVQDYLRQGDCYQINLTQRFEANFTGDPYSAYLELSAQNNTPFSAFLRLPIGAILSVSPERFIQCRAGDIQAKPIKGTMPRAQDPKQDSENAKLLVNSEKDRSENLMIVDLLRNDIGRCAQPGSVTVPKLFDIESFKNVHHLVSTVQAKLPRNASPLELLKGAFPGGSITGAPKIRAMDIIDELEPHRRTIYCGSIGYISADHQMDTNITIRTLLCLEDKVYCWAGGAIVADSNVKAEYQECFDKVASILPVLSLTKEK